MIDPEENDDNTRQLNVPVLYVQASQDPSSGAQQVQKLFQATAGPKKIWWIEGALRRQETYSYVGDHLEGVLAFAAEHIKCWQGY